MSSQPPHAAKNAPDWVLSDVLLLLGVLLDDVRLCFVLDELLALEADDTDADWLLGLEALDAVDVELLEEKEDFEDVDALDADETLRGEELLDSDDAVEVLLDVDDDMLLDDSEDGDEPLETLNDWLDRLLAEDGVDALDAELCEADDNDEPLDCDSDMLLDVEDDLLLELTDRLDWLTVLALDWESCAAVLVDAEDSLESLEARTLSSMTRAAIVQGTCNAVVMIPPLKYSLISNVVPRAAAPRMKLAEAAVS